MKRLTTILALIALAIFGAGIPASAQTKKPNIVVIMGDDVGIWNISAYHRGMMGGRRKRLRWIRLPKQRPQAEAA